MCVEWFFYHPLVVVSARLIIVALTIFVAAILTATLTAILVLLVLFVFHKNSPF